MGYRQQRREALDNIVCDEFSQLASNLNNEGEKSQIAWLKEQRGYTDNEVEELIKNEISESEN